MILRKRLEIETPKEWSLNNRSVRTREGSIMILFTVVLIAMIGLTALALDVQNWISQKHSLQNVSDNMSISALDCYYNNELLNNLIVGLTVQQQVEARITSGMRCAQNVYATSRNVLMDKDKMAGPIARHDDLFLGEDWQEEYEDLMDSLEEGDPISFHEGPYQNSAVRFLDENGVHVIPSHLPSDVTSELVLRANVNFAYNENQSVQPILSQVLSGIRFQPATDSKAEAVNLGMTRSLVLAMNRGFPMAWDTVPGDLYTTNHAIQFESTTIQPMQRLVETAKILPEILADQNRFRDPEFNNSFGIVMFDVAAEAVELNSGPGDPDEHLSHDEGGNGYQDVMNVLNQPVIGGEVPRIGNIIRANPPGWLSDIEDFKIEDPTCDENHCPMGGPCPTVTDPCGHDSFMDLNNFKRHWYWYDPNTSGDPEDLWRLRDPAEPPDRYLGTFYPWTGTDSSIGLEIAIEMIRQERERLRQLFDEAFVDKKFSGEIVFLSDASFYSFHDSNIPLTGPDHFPNGANTTGSFFCDVIGITDVPNLPFTSVIHPVSWRRRVTQPRAYGDLYHDGFTFYDISTGYDPDHPPAGFEPLGVETNVNTSHATIYQNVRPCANAGDPGCCPGPDCVGNVTSAPTTSYQQTHAKMATTYNGQPLPANVELYCTDLAVMDYARWAEANKITIHALGFALAGGGWDPVRGGYLLEYMTDPSKDDKNVGLRFDDVGCSGGGSTCPEVERAFKRIGRNIQIKLAGP